MSNNQFRNSIMGIPASESVSEDDPTYAQPGRLAPQGSLVWLLSVTETLIQPVQYLSLNPSHPVGAKLYPLGE